MTLRRTRNHPALREALGDARVHAQNLMYPMFVRPGAGVIQPVASMPGVAQYSVDTLLTEVERLVALGLRSLLLFGVIDAAAKDEAGSHAWGEHAIVAEALKALKQKFPDLLLAVDLCFCEYTSHGHCGVPHPTTTVANHQTVVNLGLQAVALAKAGADLIAPSGMMDGAVRGIRCELDAAGFEHIPIMGYSVKYASAFYGPFRDVAESAPAYGDRRQYQMDPRRGFGEALLEAQADIAEGADIIMVKPGLPYLDILAQLRERVSQPLAAYHVSGEYAMLKAAGKAGWIDEDRVLRETLVAFRRAGASIVISYGVPRALELIQADSSSL